MALFQHRPPKPTYSGRNPAPAPAAGATLRIEGRGLHPRLEAVLHRVQEAERTAVGNQRRPTFRLMRELLGASVQLGVPIAQLADCLGSSRNSVRNRVSGCDDPMSAELIRQLTGLTPAQLDRLSGGELTRAGKPSKAAGQASAYLTIDVVRALLATPQPKPLGRQGETKHR